jgi:sensor domain CHASE-containing protein
LNFTTTVREDDAPISLNITAVVAEDEIELNVLFVTSIVDVPAIKKSVVEFEVVPENVNVEAITLIKWILLSPVVIKNG